ncbi:MAG: SHOCT domain-containing protein [Oscillospiraceae bacterium]|nr:SHOCT domain-containing protein [Oscillospiraceae bacterium]
MTKAPGKSLLQVTGILYLVVAGFAVLGLATQGFISSATLHTGYIIFMGIMGIKYCASKEKADTLRVLAIIDIALISFFVFVAVAFVGEIRLAFMNLLTIPLPILFMIGAMRNERMAVEPDDVLGVLSGEKEEKQIDVDQLRNLKVLLDEGIITQAEFDAKKREALRL